MWFQLLMMGGFGMVYAFFPAVLFYGAFLSGSEAFSYAANNRAELFYLFFMLTSVVLSALVIRFWIKPHPPSIKLRFIGLAILKVAIGLYAIILVLNTVSRFINFQSEAIDVVFFQRAIGELASFHLPAYAWSQHFSLFLTFLVPFYWISQSGAWLMFIQAGWVVGGAITLYMSAHKKLGSQFLALALSVTYLTFGGLQFGYAYGFHEIMFLPPLFFWAYYFYLSNRLKWYLFWVFLCLSVKEEVSFIMIFWGLYLIYIKNYRFARWTIFSGVIWYLLCFRLIFPLLNPGAGFGYWGQYPGGNGIIGLVQFGLSHPVKLLTGLLTPKYKIDTIIHSFGNFSFLSFLYPPSLIIVIPSLLEKLLSSDIAAKNGFHYSSAITAVVLVSVAETLAKLQNRLNHIIKYKNIFLGLIILYTGILANMIYGYHPLSPLLLGKEDGLNQEQIDVLNHAIASIPENASVAAQYHIRSHIKKPYWQTTEALKEQETADYVIVNIGLPLIMGERDNLGINLVKNIQDGRYEVLIFDSGTLLLKRKDVTKPVN